MVNCVINANMHIHACFQSTGTGDSDGARAKPGDVMKTIDNYRPIKDNIKTDDQTYQNQTYSPNSGDDLTLGFIELYSG